jgi:4-methyl-5(b-hydroxyethyl)-thiazole monophosphate biosynthesis
MSRTVLVPVADGTEELEAVAIIDTLRRAGALVTVAAIGAGLEVTCSRGVKLVADTRIADLGAASFDLIALPGGLPGAEHLHDSPDLTALLRAHAAAGGLLAAVCAAPVVVLARHGLLGDRRVTAHPSVFAELPESQRSEDRVVVDDGLVTSRGAGTALEFALALVEQLFGAERRADVAKAMLA